jgi:glycosyltransferase involved in cell wall biosynthesis
VPAVAFDVGGVREWLVDNETGRLVPPPASAAALARAIEDCVSDRQRLSAWGEAARARSRNRTLAAHVAALETLFVRAADTRVRDHAQTRRRELRTKDQPTYA